MSEKYIDLASLITDEIGGYQTEHAVTLNWLDRLAAEHPDQAPGRTITESGFQELMEDVTTPYQVGFSDGFFLAGGRIVPDPEPTNAEKIEALINESEFRPIGYHGVTAASALAHELDKAGVKAPGGGDDQ